MSELEEMPAPVVKVSVVMTTFNHEKFIAQAIESALMQEADFEYEIIIGEDCSSDKTRSIVLEFQRRHPGKIRLSFPSRNLGNDGNSMLRRVLELAKGQYIALLDGDDYWTSPTKLQKQVNVLEADPDCAICFHNAMRVYEDRAREPHLYNPGGHKPISTSEDLLRGNFIATCSAVLRRNACETLPDWFETSAWGDWALYILAAQHGTIGYIDEVMGVYRVHGSGVWSKRTTANKLQADVAFYEQLPTQLKLRYGTLVKSMVTKRCFQLAVARSSLPYEVPVIVVSQGDDELLNLDGRPAWPFQQSGSGPEMIGQLEDLRAKGARYLVFPDAASSWLDENQIFKRHIDSHYCCVWREEHCAIYGLLSKTIIEVVHGPSCEGNGEQLWGCNIELPESGRRPAGHRFEIEGWVLGRSARAVAVEVVSNGTVLQRVPLHRRRPDVAEAYPHVPDAEGSGFQTTVTLTGMAGMELWVQAVLQNQDRAPLGSIHARRAWRGVHTGGSPLVSVVIPCYNQAHFLGQAIESVLAQSYPNFEVVVVDDGSADNTQAVTARYPSVRCIRQRNQGLPAARNAGLLCSQGSYLVFLDADDRLLPQALETGLDCFESHPECALVAGHYQLISADGAFLADGPWLPVDDPYVSLLRVNYIGLPASVMYRRSVFAHVNGFDTSLRASEDYDLYFRIARSFSAWYHGKHVGEYRQHGANMSSKSDLMLRSTLTVHRSQWKHVKNSKERKEAYEAGRQFWQRAYGEQLVERVRVQLQQREWTQALDGTQTLLRYYPRGVASLLPAIVQSAGALTSPRAGYQDSPRNSPERCHDGDLRHIRSDWCLPSP